jgi:hypothetical protein
MTCPNGKHIMDPSWPECPYCRSEGLLPPKAPAASAPNVGEPVRRPTLVEGNTPAPTPFQPRTFQESQPLAPRPVGKPLSQQGTPQPSPPPSPGSKPGRNPTVFSPIPQGATTGSPSPPPLSTGRRIVGILITYSWRPEGQLFPLREGRNLIGRDPECEVCVPEDQTMSGRNSHITFRQNFVIGDLVSMMGTDLNGVPIEEQFKSLGNYAQIRAGSTSFTFIMIQAPE